MYHCTRQIYCLFTISGSQNTKQEEVQNVWSSSRWGNTSFVKLGRKCSWTLGSVSALYGRLCVMLVFFSFSLQNPLCLLYSQSWPNIHSEKERMKIGKLMQAQFLLWHLLALSQSALLFLKPGLHTNLGCFFANLVRVSARNNRLAFQGKELQL